MCGIIGFTGKIDAKDVVLNGLKSLEYRGYDSAGVAFFYDNKMNIYKEVGKVEKLEKLLSKKIFNSNCAIAHTRWATHGMPSIVNSHPHKVGSVTLVHNGIIENYLSLKDIIIKENINLVSDTDSEVACGYIYYIKETHPELSNLQVFRKACLKFKGSFAFGVMFDDEPYKIYASRLDSPLIIAKSDVGNFISSDVSAVLDYTNEYTILSQNDFCVITPNDIKLYNKKLNEYSPNFKIANLDKNTYMKNGYDHFMLKEINEQPKLIENIFDNYFNLKEPLIKKMDYSKYSNIKIVACGSAMHAGMVVKYYFEKYANLKTDVEVASEFRYSSLLIDKSSTLVIIISQSGETADSLASLRISNKNGFDTLAVVNVSYSSIAREAKYKLLTNAGPEIAVATTKGYTTQVASLLCLAFEFMKNKNINLEEMEKVKKEYKNLSENLNEIIKDTNNYKKIAKQIHKSNDVFFIGRGIDYALCMEASLKLKEISYINSIAYPAGELKHGTISLIEGGTKVIAINTQESTFDKTLSNIYEVKSRGADVFSISLDKYFKDEIFEPNVYALHSLNNFLDIFIVTIFLQLLAYEVALLKKCDIDRPKNLAKSVTVE